MRCAEAGRTARWAELVGELFVYFFVGLDLLLLLYRLLFYDRGRRLRQCGRLPVEVFRPPQILVGQAHQDASKVSVGGRGR